MVTQKAGDATDDRSEIRGRSDHQKALYDNNNFSPQNLLPSLQTHAQIITLDPLVLYRSFSTVEHHYFLRAHGQATVSA